MITCMVLEPDGVQIEGGRQVQDVGAATLQQVREAQLGAGTGTAFLTMQEVYPFFVLS